jgi:hypothetical protein
MLDFGLSVESPSPHHHRNLALSRLGVKWKDGSLIIGPPDYKCSRGVVGVCYWRTDATQRKARITGTRGERRPERGAGDCGTVGAYPGGTTLFFRHKSETRSPKSETSSKSQWLNAPNTPGRSGFGISPLVLWLCFGFRASDFGFRAWRLVVLPECARTVLRRAFLLAWQVS